MPVYDERATLKQVVERVLAVPLELEAVCVDDGSSDGSREILSELQRQHPHVKVFLQPRNMGKGAALRRGIQQTTGDFVVIQDADLEYDPADYSLLLDPLVQGKADVVCGPRFLGAAPHRVLYFWHSVVGAYLRRRKKIGWKDGLRAVWCLLKYSMKESPIPSATRRSKPCKTAG
jgi:glycosyltransferase involved in cell wall biosynthesis